MDPLIVQKLLLVHFYQVLLKDQVSKGTILIRPLADDKISQKFFFFHNNRKHDIKHGFIVDWLSDSGHC